MTVDHQRAGKVQNDLRSTGREVRDVRYGEAVTIEIGLPDADVEAFRAWLADATAGEAVLELGERPTGTCEPVSGGRQHSLGEHRSTLYTGGSSSGGVA